MLARSRVNGARACSEKAVTAGLLGLLSTVIAQGPYSRERPTNLELARAKGWPHQSAECLAGLVL
jgi:hypothetical protein